METLLPIKRKGKNGISPMVDFAKWTCCETSQNGIWYHQNGTDKVIEGNDIAVLAFVIQLHKIVGI